MNDQYILQKNKIQFRVVLSKSKSSCMNVTSVPTVEPGHFDFVLRYVWPAVVPEAGCLSKKKWKIAIRAQKCVIAGAVFKLTDVPDNQVQPILLATGVEELSQLKTH